MSASQSKFYIVEVICREVKAFDGSVMVAQGTKAYLGESEGYPSVTTHKEHAKRFETPPKRYVIAKWDGMPWYYRFTEAEIIPCVETKVYSLEEGERIEVPLS